MYNKCINILYQSKVFYTTGFYYFQMHATGQCPQTHIQIQDLLV